MFKKIWLYLLIIFIVEGTIAVVYYILPKYIPIPAEQRTLAQSSVFENAAWQPVVRRIEGVDMALVPAGCFKMGSTDEQLVEAITSCIRYYGAFGCQETFENEQPAHQVCLTHPYWIDLTLVTNRQYGSNSNQGHDASPYRGPSWPRESVTWREATDFCANRGAHLPTEAEWEFAARGPDALIYPFGDDYDINEVTLHILNPVPVGRKPGGASWFGALDMSGGIAEWVADWYGPYSAYPITDPIGPPSGDLRITRGGDWFAHAAYFVCTTYREPHKPDFASSAVGFHCAVDYVP